MRATRKEWYARGYLEGAESCRLKDGWSYEGVTEGVKKDRLNPDISDAARTWNVGFARGYRHEARK